MLARSAFRPRQRNSGRADTVRRAPGFLQWLRGRPCCVESYGGCSLGGRIEAAHVDHAGGKGVGIKVADRHTIPLCSGHHRDQHAMGWSAFEGRYSFDAVADAVAYWAAWPGRVAWERDHGE